MAEHRGNLAAVTARYLFPGERGDYGNMNVVDSRVRTPAVSMTPTSPWIECGAATPHLNVGVSKKVRLVPARTTVLANGAVSADCGMVTPVPPTLVPSSRCSVT